MKKVLEFFTDAVVRLLVLCIITVIVLLLAFILPAAALLDLIWSYVELAKWYWIYIQPLFTEW